MKAAVYHGAHDIRIEERPMPSRGVGEALVRVLRSGICGTDATEWRSGPHLFPVEGRHPITGHVGPLIPGHEFVGEIVEPSPEGPFAPGDLVAAGAGVWCGECPRCREGRFNLCWSYTTLGLNVDGGLAEYVAAPELMLAPLPPGIPLDVAGLAQPLAVGFHAARRSGVRDGDRVVLIGAGAIGTFVLAALRSLSRAEISVVDFAGAKLDRASRVGATRVVPTGESVVDEILAVVHPRGADVVIEASGAPGQLANAIRMVRAGGTVLQVGLPPRPAEIDLAQLVLREVTLRTTNAHVFPDDLPAALELLAQSDLGGLLLDSVHPLDDIAVQLERLATGRVDGKILLDPWRGPSR